MTGPVFSWFLPVRGDSRDPNVVTPADGTRADLRRPTLDYLTAVAQAAELAGFHSVLTPVGIGCLDPWVVCSAVAARTSRLGFLLAFRPTLASATLLAQQAQSFAALFGRRLALNVVTGGDPTEQAAYGDLLGHDERYAAAEETLEVMTRLLAGERVAFAGRYREVRDARLPEITPAIDICVGGASGAAHRLGARFADVQLLWAESVAAVSKRLAQINAVAADVVPGRRPLRFGIRLHVLSRDTSDAAWEEADRIQAGFDPVAVARVQARTGRMDSVGQARMAALHDGRRPASARQLTAGPNLWTGIGLVRQGAALTLVGSHDEVADRLAEYHRAGVGEFILSGYPHLEEALRFGEDVAPRVRARLAESARSRVEAVPRSGDRAAAVTPITVPGLAFPDDDVKVTSR